MTFFKALVFILANRQQIVKNLWIKYSPTVTSHQIQHQIYEEWSSFKWRVTMSGELMFLESYGNCDVTDTLILIL